MSWTKQGSVSSKPDQLKKKIAKLKHKQKKIILKNPEHAIRVLWGKNQTV